MPTFPKLSESFIVGKFLALLGRGWDVHVLCSKSEPEEFERFPELSRVADLRKRVHVNRAHTSLWSVAAGIPVAMVRGWMGNPHGFLRYIRRMASLGVGALFKKWYLDSALIELKPDLVHFEFGATAVGREHLRHALGCPIVASFRGYDINLSGLTEANYYDALWKEVSSVHFLGEALKKRAVERGFSARSSHVLIPPSIDVDYFSPPKGERTGSESRVRILSVGRMTWEKGYEHGMAAIAKLQARGIPVEYRVIGDGPLMEGLCFQRYRLGLEGVVTFLGAMDRSRVREEMRACDLFLHASVSEGFCNSVLEAQAMEIPVVCSDAGGLPENVEHGVTGLVVPRRNAGALADALAQLAMNPELRAKLGEAGRRRVVQHFDMASRVAQFEEWYTTVAREKPQREGIR